MNAVAKLEQAVADYHEGLARIDREFDATGHRRTQLPSTPANAGREKRKSNWQSIFATRWEKLATEIAHAHAQLRRHQPAFVDFGPNHPQIALKIPEEISFGSHQASFEKFSCRVPHSIPFPLDRALVLPEASAEHQYLIHHLLLRLLSVMPPGQLELTLIDPLQLGQSIEPFLPLLTVAALVPQQRVLTRSDEIETVLGKLTDEVEELIQHRFNHRASNWSDYNANNADTPLSYKVVLLFDVPEQLSEKSLWFLGRLCENGPRCGVLPILAVDGDRMDDRRHEKFRATVGASAMRLDALLRGADTDGSDLSLAYQPEPWPRHDLLDGFISALAARHAAKARFSKSMLDLWVNLAAGATTTNGFDIPIGWNTAGEVVPLNLGATTSEHHALLAGKTGSGKSNVLHVLIHALCEKYSPAEAELYLLDYKESTEFSIYATPSLPHARLVATESDPEYGVTVLRHLADELKERSRVFKKAGVRDFTEYRRASREPMPRILLVIDEFQVLFSETRQIAEAAEQLLSQLLKQGRSFGIHILLATQTLKGINTPSIGSITTQLGCRIALACGQDDSAMILGGGNWAAAELRSPPEGIINNANGAKSGNLKFLIPLAESARCREHIAALSASAMPLGMPVNKTRVFSGSRLPELPSSGEYETLWGKTDALLLGERLTFNADALTIPLVHRAAFNVLFSGYNDQIHDGLLAAVLSSMAVATSFEEVVYFNGRGVFPDGGFSTAAQALGTRFKMFDDLAALPLRAISDNIGSRHVALIIDGLDAEKALHPAPAFRVPKPGEPPSPADLLKRIAEDGPRKGTFVFAFVDRWQRCAGACKDLFSVFELRVGYCMNEDDAGSFVSGGIGKFKGIEKPNRAVFMNKMTNDVSWFRPYVKESIQ